MRNTGIYLCLALLILISSWEYQQSAAASIMTETVIPEDSIRLRVLSHTDHPQDQWLKREVRDQVTQQMATWAEDLEQIDQAREKLQGSLNELEELVEQTISASGFDYDFSLEYGQIGFPSKLYGQQFYPAGEYEGLLITIGAGQGDNWWCVLFPPLCFVDFGTGEVLDPDQEAAEQPLDAEEDTGVEVRFFFADLFETVKSWWG